MQRANAELSSILCVLALEWINMSKYMSKTVSYVSRKLKQLRKKSRVSLDPFSLKVTELCY